MKINKTLSNYAIFNWGEIMYNRFKIRKNTIKSILKQYLMEGI